MMCRSRSGFFFGGGGFLLLLLLLLLGQRLRLSPVPVLVPAHCPY
jgi:hypothetical protein